MTTFDPVKGDADLTGKTVLVTGGTAGLGKETLFLLGPRNPSKLIFTGRNAEAAASITADYQAKFPGASIEFVTCDLASLPSVKQAASKLLSSNDRIDILMAVAGVMTLPPAVTAQGYEIQFGTNHMGHALLIKLLLPLLQRTASSSPSSDVRIVIYSSEAAELLAPWSGIEFDKLKTPQDTFLAFGTWRRYGQSKLANLLYARSLAARFPDILTVAIHPGVAHTELSRDSNQLDKLVLKLTTFGMAKSIHEVSLNGVWAALAPRKDGRNGGGQVVETAGGIENGQYYKPVGVLGPQRKSLTNDEMADRLWEWTEKELEGCA